MPTLLTALPAFDIPSGTPPVPDDGGFEHLYCCDPELSLCGLDLTGVQDADISALERPCPFCEALDDSLTPCRPGCTPTPSSRKDNR